MSEEGKARRRRVAVMPYRVRGVASASITAVTPHHATTPQCARTHLAMVSTRSADRRAAYASSSTATGEYAMSRLPAAMIAPMVSGAGTARVRSRTAGCVCV